MLLRAFVIASVLTLWAVPLTAPSGPATPTPSAAAAQVVRAPSAVAAPAPGVVRFVIVAGASSVTYNVDETFVVGARFNTAVGITTDVRGEVFVDRARPSNTRIGAISIDISKFKSDSERRDAAIRQRWLESERYPTAEFAPTRVAGLPETYVEGREVPVQIEGNLRIREATRPTHFASTVRLEGSVLTVAGRAVIKMTDFGFDPPSILGVLRAENEVRLEFRFVARP